MSSTTSSSEDGDHKRREILYSLRKPSQRSQKSVGSLSFSTTANTSYGSSGSGQLRVPLNLDKNDKQLLVGRSRETTLLHSIYDRIRQSGAASECVLVQGESGTGKSALIAESLEQLVKQSGGAWAVGKFVQLDDYERPYSAVVDAITMLCQEISEGSSSSHLEEICQQVEEALGSERHILTNLIPAIENLASMSTFSCGPTNHHQVSNEFAFQRFMGLICSFLRAVASPQHPVCIVLDDLQFADDASRRLIQAIASDASSKHILLVGATRNPNDDIFQPGNTKHTLSCTNIGIGNLSAHCVNEIVAQATEMRTEKTRELSQILFQKTIGNAFFVKKYLEMLHSTGLLVFSFETAQWTWNATEIQKQTNVADNVGDLLIGRIEELPTKTKQVLMVAACLNSSFDMQVLETIMSTVLQEEVLEKTMDEDSEDPIDTTETTTDFSETVSGDDSMHTLQSTVNTQNWGKMVQNAVHAGMLEQLSEGRYKFSHDRVQQAALSMVPSGEEGRRFRYLLGEIVLKLSYAEGAEDWMLFTAVNLLTKSSRSRRSGDKLKDQELASACLAAAKKASERSAFISAAKYADKGLDLLSVGAWVDSYELCLDLHILSCLNHYAYGNVERSDKTATRVLLNAECLEDKLKAYKVRISIYASRGDLGGAVAAGLDVINKLGVSLPAYPTKRQVNRAFKKVNKLMTGCKPSDLRDLPTITDPSIIDRLRFIHSNTVYSWHAGRANLCILQCLIMMDITLTHGVCQFTPHAVSVYGGIISNEGRLEEAFEFGTLALELLERPGMREETPISLKVVHLFLNHLRKPLYDSLEPLLRGYRIGMEQGDIQIASRILSLHGVLSVIAGMPIENLAGQLEGYCDFFREYKQYDCLLEVLPLLQFARNLIGASESPLLLQDVTAEKLAIFKEDPSLRENLVIQLHTVSANMLLSCVFGDFESAVAECTNLRRFENITYSYFMKPFLMFLTGFSYLCLGQESNLMNQIIYKRQGGASMRDLKKFVKSGSLNCVPLLVLLEAELLALNEPADTVVSKYESAISMSGRSGFRLIKSIACERCGEYLLRCGKTPHARELASDYLSRAITSFSEYGAEAKVSQMERKYFHQNVDLTKSQPGSPRSFTSQQLQPHLTTEWKKEL